MKPKTDVTRRKLIRSLATGSGLVVGAKALPENWTRPVVQSVVLPAHAQLSGVTSADCAGELNQLFPGIPLPAVGGGTVDVFAGENFVISLSNITGAGTHQLEVPPGNIVSGPVAWNVPVSFTFPANGTFTFLHQLNGGPGSADILWSCGGGGAMQAPNTARRTGPTSGAIRGYQSIR